MAGDNLKELLDLARAEMPDIPEEAWSRLEGVIRANFGTARLYIAARKKARHLQEIEASSTSDDPEQLARRMGVSVRRLQQLKKLR